MRKLFLFSFVFMCLVLDATAQEEFDNKLSAVSNDIATKLNNKGIKTVAVSTFTNLDGQVTHLGKYIAEEFSVNLSNATGGFALMDRNHFQQILAEHKLKSDGLTDPATAKELGKWVNVDAIVIGTIEVLTEKIRLVVKVLDIKTTFIIGASRGDLPNTPSITKIISSTSTPPETSKPEGVNTSNRNNNGRPLGSNESYGTQTVNKACQTNNTGDYGFTNNTRMDYNVAIDRKFDVFASGKTINVKAGETKWFYDLKSGPHSFNITEQDNSYKYYTFGDIYVEQCQAKIFEIK